MLGNNKPAPEVGCTPARRSPAGEASPLNSWQTVGLGFALGGVPVASDPSVARLATPTSTTRCVRLHRALLEGDPANAT
jgi:hypothetical protein